MSTPLLVAVSGFLLVNVIGLVLARAWSRFALFYLADVAMLAGIGAAIVLNAPLDAGGDSWAGRVIAYGHAIDSTEAGVLAFGTVWLFLLAAGAVCVAIAGWLPQIAPEDDRGGDGAVAEEPVRRGRPLLALAVFLAAGLSFVAAGRFLLGGACLAVAAVRLPLEVRSRRIRARSSCPG